MTTFAQPPPGLLASEPRAGTPHETAKTESFARRFGVRFAFSYWLIFNFPQPLSNLPFLEPLTDAYDGLWRAIVPWVGRHLLGLSRDVAPSKSGTSDSAYDYVWLFCVFALAAASALAWSLFEPRAERADSAERTDRAERAGSAERTERADSADRPRHEHDARLRDGLRIYLRYVLALTMLTYGMLKMVKVQFPTPAIEQLSRTYGDSSPQSLLWAFMGYSSAYSAFTGGAEVLGGLLLCFRRTTALGALLIATVMANVVVLNFCYDVGVKLYSSHLLLMALFLLAADARRLINVLALGRPAAAASPRVPFRSRRLERARPALKAMYVGGSVVLALGTALMIKKHRDKSSPANALAGPYTLEASAPTAEEAPAPGDIARWRTIIVGQHGSLVVRRDDGSTTRWAFRVDPAAHTLTLRPGLRDALPGGAEQIVLRYEEREPGRLIIEGALGGAPLSLVLSKAPEPEFPLMAYRFHWVQETTYND